MIKIRKASLSDLDQLVPLFDAYRVFYEQTSDVKSARTFLHERISKNQSTILIGEKDGTAIGFTQIYPLFSSVSMQSLHLLNDLFVDPNCRGEGIGEKLLEAAKEFAIEQGSKGLNLETHHTNPARKLYERLGWVNDQDYLHFEWKA